MDTKKISVLIPMYNRKIYIEDCINSVLKQTFSDYEIVIRDDASTDGVFEFVKNHYDKEISRGKIILLRNEKNLGELKTLSKLLFDAKGMYITILHIRRDSPYSQTNDINSSIYKFENSIPSKLKVFRGVDKFTNDCEFLRDNEELKYYIKTKFFFRARKFDERR